MDQNGAHAFVVVRDGYSEVTIFRVNLASGNREVWKQIRPADPAGILSLRSFFVTPSGSAYTYSAGRARAALYVSPQQ